MVTYLEQESYDLHVVYIRYATAIPSSCALLKSKMVKYLSGDGGLPSFLWKGEKMGVLLLSVIDRNCGCEMCIIYMI